MLRYRDGSEFTTGMSSYLDADPGQRSETSRIHVKVEFDGVTVLALLDTGASWSVLNAELAQALGLFERDGESAKISSRAGTIDGKLVRAATTLVADEGESIEIDSTVFVSSDWPEGNFIGYSGFLEKIRFAIDPSSNSFVFGALGIGGPARR